MEAELGKRAIILFFGLLGLVGLGWLGGRLEWPCDAPPQQTEKAPVQIIKEPAMVASRTFDPAAPPADMPPLHASEIAVCDSDFVSNASVAGESRQEDATHATITITHVSVTLELHVTIWVPFKRLSTWLNTRMGIARFLNIIIRAPTKSPIKLRSDTSADKLRSAAAI